MKETTPNSINKIVYIGTFAYGTIHQMFDTCLLDVCTHISKKVICYKDKSTFPYIKESAIKNNYNHKIELKHLYVYNSKGRWGDFYKSIIGAFQNIRMYLKTENDSLIIYSNNNPLSLHIINLLNRFIKKQTIIVCHGELELLKNNNGGLAAKLHRFFLKDFFLKRIISSNLKFIVLGDSIKENLRKVIPQKSFHHFIAIDHPYYFPNNEPSKRKDNIHLGLIGTLSPSKGLDSFIKFVSNLKEKFPITIVGRLSTPIYNIYLKENKIRVTQKFLSRKELEREVSLLDYVLYFYPVGTYSLTASGAVFDAICLNKPIIALKNDYFDYISKKSKYPFILFDNIDDMTNYLLQNNIKEFDNNEFEEGKTIFSPINIAKTLKNELLNSFQK